MQQHQSASGRQTCLPQNTSVTAPNCPCLYFQIFHQIFLRMHHQSKQNSVKGQFFYCSSCKKSVRTHIFSFTDALHLHDFILFTSVKVVLDRRPQNTFSKNNAPCVLLSLMPMHPFLNKSCLVGVCFLAFFLLFIDFVQPLIIDNSEFKPAILEDG